jgi:hypothetical protein
VHVEIQRDNKKQDILEEEENQNEGFVLSEMRIFTKLTIIR